MTLDLDTIDPGIRRTVAWLRSENFVTTDSGDGRTKIANGDAEALPYPHVAMTSHPTYIAMGAAHLRERLKEMGVIIKPMSNDENEPCIQATIDPANMTGIIMLMGVDDALLFGGAK